MKLLVLSAWYPNRVYKNDGNFVRNLAELVADVHEVTVLTVVPDGNLPMGDIELTEAVEGVLRVIRVYYSGAGTRVQRMWARKGAWRNGTERSGRDFDLIHAHILIDGGIFARKFARQMGIPYLITEHASRWLKTWPAGRYFERWLARRAARDASYVLPVSPALEDGMRQQGIKAKLEVLPNAVDDQVFYPAEVKENAPFTFLHVSDFSPNKRLDLILTAFFRLQGDHPEIKLHLAGDGELSRLLELSRSLHPRPRQNEKDLLGLSVSGPHQPHEIAGLMRQADCFLLASEYETQSVVLLEAQLCGLPAIATQCGGPDTIVNTRNAGALIPVNDGEALVRAMEKALFRGKNDLAERQQLSQQARGRYASEAVRKRLLAYYENACHA